MIDHDEQKTKKERKKERKKQNKTKRKDKQSTLSRWGVIHLMLVTVVISGN